MKKAFLALAGLALAATQAVASPVYFRAPMNFAGTGCPVGSIAVTGENTDTLTIMFDSYDAANPPGEASSKKRRASCNFAVPVHVPQGYQVSTMTSDWRGYAEGQTELRREYFIAGQRGPSKTSRPKGDYTERDNLMHATFSPCGAGDITLRINSSVKAKKRNSYIAVDTIDLQNRVVFHMQWRQCR